MTRLRPTRMRRTRGQARTIGLVLLAVFGLVLILASIGVFCFLTGEPLGPCLVDVLSPF